MKKEISINPKLQRTALNDMGERTTRYGQERRNRFYKQVLIANERKSPGVSEIRMAGLWKSEM